MNPEKALMIGQRIQRIRKARKKTLAVVAGLAGMSKSKLDRIELGEVALDKLSDVVALANALEVAPADLMRLPLPAPANGHTDSTIEAVGQALDGIDAEQLDGLVLPVAQLREQVARMQARVRACQFAEVAIDLPELISNLHTTLTAGADLAELLELAVVLHVTVTRRWLVYAGAHTQLRRRVVFLAQRLARERDEVTTLAVAGWGVAIVLLNGGSVPRGRAVLESITLPPTTDDTARLVAQLTREHAAVAALDGRPDDAAAPMNVVADLAERFGVANVVDSRGFYFTPVDVAVSRAILALNADQPDQAVNIARQVDPRHHPLPLNQSGYWMLAGRALSKLPGRGDDAVRALRTAEQIFPTRVLRNHGVREILGEMLTNRSVRTMGLELRGMAYRAGVLTEEHQSD